jgi:hypothetical protein
MHETIKHLEGVAKSLTSVGAHADAESVRRTINEQKAKRMEKMAAEFSQAQVADKTQWEARGFHPDYGPFVDRQKDLAERAALLRESAALWRDRHPDDALWELEYQRRYKRFDLCVGEGFDGLWRWCATRSGLQAGCGTAPTLAAAQAAAVAWVDRQEKE